MAPRGSFYDPERLLVFQTDVKDAKLSVRSVWATAHSVDPFGFITTACTRDTQAELRLPTGMPEEVQVRKAWQPTILRTVGNFD